MFLGRAACRRSRFARRMHTCTQRDAQRTPLTLAGSLSPQRSPTEPRATGSRPHHGPWTRGSNPASSNHHPTTPPVHQLCSLPHLARQQNSRYVSIPLSSGDGAGGLLSGIGIQGAPAPLRPPCRDVLFAQPLLPSAAAQAAGPLAQYPRRDEDSMLVMPTFLA